MNRYQAIIFDMDGLMVDTEPLSRQAWDEFLRPYGAHISDDMHRQMIGLRADLSTELIRQTYHIPLPAEEMIRQRKPIYAQIMAQGAPIMPGLLALQAEIQKRALPWAVASSSERHHVQTVLTQLNLADRVKATACGDEVRNGKPAPDLYLLAASRLGISPERCIALEDSRPGSQAAVAAGMRTIAVPNEHTRQADFSHVWAVYPSLAEVAAQLDSLLA